MTELNGKSLDILQENIAALRNLFPEVCCEDKVDFDKLRQILGDYVDDNKERYNFTWNGKGQSLRLSQTPSMGTLRPCVEESKNWDTTQNLYIEGDNLEVLKLLQKSYHGKIKMIYIDPPYNTGNDFVYPDDFSDSIDNYKKLTGQVDEEGHKLSTNTDANGRFHTDWLNMMYPRLRLSKNLLSNDGILMMSIDNNEISNAKKICDEVFGEESFVTIIHTQMSTVQGQKVRAAKAGNIVKNGEYILVYSKDGHKDIGKHPMLDPVKYDNHYNRWISNKKSYYEETSLIEIILSKENIVSELLRLNLASSESKISATKFQDYYEISPMFRKFINNNAERIVRVHDSIDVPEDYKKTMQVGRVYQYDAGSRTYFVCKNENNTVTQRIQLSEKLKIANDFYSTYGPTTIRGDWWSGFYLDMGNVSKEGGVSYDNGKKPVRLIKQLIDFCTDGNDIILDFFAGSATTAHAIMELDSEQQGKRKFIMIQLDEDLDSGYENSTGETKTEIKRTIDFLDSCGKCHRLSEIGKERIRRAGEKIKAEIEEESAQLKIGEEPKKVPDIGFKVFKLDSSNLKKWQPDYDDLETSLFDSISNYVDGRTEQDVVYEIMLKMGLDLTWPLEVRSIAGKNVYLIGLGALIICLDDEITTDVAHGMAEMHKELTPEIWKVVFKDNGFVNDSTKVNVKEILKCAGLDEDAFTTV